VDLVSSDGSGDMGIDTDLPRDVDEAVMQVKRCILSVIYSIYFSLIRLRKFSPAVRSDFLSLFS
jgi:hypothetical protein